MSGFEVIVRPVVFPNIRPAPSRSLPLADDPEAGKFTFSGSNGQVIALNHSFSASGSMSGGTETERTYDVARIKQIDDSGNVNEDVYIDVEVVKQIKMRDTVYNYKPIEEASNIEIIEWDMVR